jgi:hypothetical protein
MRYLVLLMFLVAGCAEIQLVNPKEDCRGRYGEKSGTPSYPCECCR